MTFDQKKEWKAWRCFFLFFCGSEKDSSCVCWTIFSSSWALPMKAFATRGLSLNLTETMFISLPESFSLYLEWPMNLFNIFLLPWRRLLVCKSKPLAIRFSVFQAFLVSQLLGLSPAVGRADWKATEMQQSTLKGSSLRLHGPTW